MGLIPELFNAGGIEGGAAWDGWDPSVENVFCPTGEGGGVDPSCGQHTVVGKAEHVHSAAVEREVAAAVGGEWEEDNKPYDVRVEGKHAVEVKSMLKGAKTSISVHDDALLRKVEYAKANPSETFHTVVVDERATYGGGAHAEKFSGNRMYYKRGAGRYSLSQMEPVRDAAHLKELMNAPSKQLPEKAKGALPTDVEALRARAEAAHASRLAKDRARKARLKGG